ncbi:hypothetical protein KAH94_01160, partial [bacterium]|nr:hypothetical protein [bacterium]
MKKRIIVMLSLLCVCASNAAGKKPHTFLKKAVYYAGAQTKDIKIENIDLGRVVLLFSDKKVAANKKVVMSLVPFSKKDSESKIATKKDVFVFPYSDFENTEIRKKAKTFSAIKNNYYALDLKKGANGLKLTIEYNPSIVSFERTRFS